MSEIKEKWELWASAELIKEHKDDEKFHTVIELARVVNQLKFCYQAGLDLKEYLPSSERQIGNSFLFANGVLYEGLKVARRAGKHFHELDSYKNGFLRFLNSKETKDHEAKVLEVLRNKMVFHIDNDIAKTVLPKLKFEEYVFCTAIGDTSRERYFNLADEIVFNFLVPDCNTMEKEHEYLGKMISNTTQIAGDYIQSAETLIFEVLVSYGWEKRSAPSGV